MRTPTLLASWWRPDFFPGQSIFEEPFWNDVFSEADRRVDNVSVRSHAVQTWCVLNESSCSLEQQLADEYYGVLFLDCSLEQQLADEYYGVLFLDAT